MSMNTRYFKIGILGVCVFFMYVSLSGIITVFDRVDSVKNIDFNGCWTENGDKICTANSYLDNKGKIVTYAKEQIIQRTIYYEYLELPMLTQTLAISISGFVKFFFSLVGWLGLKWTRILNMAFFGLYFGMFASSLISIGTNQPVQFVSAGYVVSFLFSYWLSGGIEKESRKNKSAIGVMN